MKKLRGAWLLATLLLFAASCNSAKEAAYVAPASWEGRLVAGEISAIRVLNEPGGNLIAMLPADAVIQATGQSVDENGRLWLSVANDTLHGWVAQDLIRLAEGEGGHIATH